MELLLSVWLVGLGLYGMFRRSTTFGDDLLPEVTIRMVAAMCFVIGVLNAF